ELTALRLHLAGREIAALRTRLARLDDDRRAITDAEHDVKATLARLDTAVLAAESRLTAVGGADLGDDLARAEQLRERARGVAARLRSLCAAAEAAELPLGTELESVQARVVALEETVAAAERTGEAARADRDRWTTRAEALALALDQARAQAGADRLAGVTGALGSLLDLVEVDDGW